MAFDANDLSPHEQYVVDRTREGEVADFSPMAGADGAKPPIRAGFLRKLLLQFEPSWPVRMPGVRIKGARIEGALDLTDCSGASGEGLPALELTACAIPDVIDLSHGRLARLALDGSSLTKLRACEAQFDGPVTLRGLTPAIEGGHCMLDFDGAQIDGSVEAKGSHLVVDPEEKSQDRIGAFALTLRNARITGNVLLRPNFKAKGGVSLYGAQIDGLVDLRGAHLTLNHRYALSAGKLHLGGTLHLNDGFRCEGPILLRGAYIGNGLHGDGGVIVLPDAKGDVDALNAEQTDINGAVSLRHGFSANGPVNFRGATLRGGIDLAKASFTSGVRCAFDLRNAAVEGEIVGNPVIQGGLCLAGAQVSRNLDLRNAEIANLHARGQSARQGEFAMAVDAPNLRVGGAVLFQGANVKGEIFLADARIEGYLAFGGGRFLNASGWAIRAPNVRVGGNLTLKIEDGDEAPHGRKTVIEGGAKFDRAQVDGALAWLNLELRGAGPDGARGAVLSLADARIGGALQAQALTTGQDALIDVSGARCAALDDDLKTGWGMESAKLDLEGFFYERLDSTAKDDTWRTRLNWLKRARREGERFSPQPFGALAQIYMRAGRREDARRVLLAQHDQRTFLASAGPFTWTLSSLFGLIAGYGFAPIRAARALLLYLVLGIAGVLAMDASHALVTPSGAPCAGAVEPALYAVDVALPVVDLGQESQCAPGRAANAHLFAGIELPDSDWRLFEGVALWRWAQALYAIIGAVLTALAILTFSGVMKPKGED